MAIAGGRLNVANQGRAEVKTLACEVGAGFRTSLFRHNNCIIIDTHMMKCFTMKCSWSYIYCNINSFKYKILIRLNLPFVSACGSRSISNCELTNGIDSLNHFMPTHNITSTAG
jgi:hypothetical protein